jgi:hypothetical protein
MNELRHGTMEELLALRDGEGSVWVRGHVDECPACAAELRRLEQVRAQLRALPTFTPPRDRWPLIAATLRQERHRHRAWGVGGMAAAAAVVVLGLFALHHTPAATSDPGLAQAMAESQAMEQVFKALKPDQRALSGGTASVVADLEARLAQVDAALSDPSAVRADPDQIAALWKQRAGLLSALVDVHETRASYAGL